MWRDRAGDIPEVWQEIDKLLITEEEIENFQSCGEHGSIVSPNHYLYEVIDSFHTDPKKNGALLPWEKTFHKFQFRPGELSIWAGYNGQKKSMLSGFTMLDFIRQGQKGCIASLEMHPRLTLKRMTQQAIGNDKPAGDYIKKLFSWLEGNLFLFDKLGTCKTDRLIRLAKYCGEKLNLDHLMIDSLMKCGMKPDDYGAQKDFLDELVSVARYTNMHIHLVAHMRKPDKDNRIPNRYDISGGSDITNQADNVLICWSDIKVLDNKQLPDEHPDKDLTLKDKRDQVLRIEKQRNGEFEGSFSLWMDERSIQFKEHPRLPINDYTRLL